MEQWKTAKSLGALYESQEAFQSFLNISFWLIDWKQFLFLNFSISYPLLIPTQKKLDEALRDFSPPERFFRDIRFDGALSLGNNGFTVLKLVERAFWLYQVSSVCIWKKVVHTITHTHTHTLTQTHTHARARAPAPAPTPTLNVKISGVSLNRNWLSDLLTLTDA